MESKIFETNIELYNKRIVSFNYIYWIIVDVNVSFNNENMLKSLRITKHTNKLEPINTERRILMSDLDKY